MTIPTADLDIEAEDSFDYEFDFLDENGDPEDLSGTKFVFVAQWGDDRWEYATDDVSPKVTITGSKVRIHILPAVTDDWPREAMPWKLKQWVGSDKYTRVMGSINVTEKVPASV
jgi:hypothetical protein